MRVLVFVSATDDTSTGDPSGSFLIGVFVSEIFGDTMIVFSPELVVIGVACSFCGFFECAIESIRKS